MPRRIPPEPLETDEVRVVAIGTALFAVGLVVTLVLRDRLEAEGHLGWVWVMVCGVVLGLIGLRTVRRRRDAARRDPAGNPSSDRTDPNPP